MTEPIVLRPALNFTTLDDEHQMQTRTLYLYNAPNDFWLLEIVAERQ